MWLNWQSSWFVISRLSVRVRSSAFEIIFISLKIYNHINYGWIPEWPKGTDCKSAAICFGGSNPPPSIFLLQLSNKFHNDAGWSSLEARRAHNPKVVGSNPAPAISLIFKRDAQIAQLVEQWTENPRVTGSIPVLGTTYFHRWWDTSSVGRALDF